MLFCLDLFREESLNGVFFFFPPLSCSYAPVGNVSFTLCSSSNVYIMKIHFTSKYYSLLLEGKTSLNRLCINNKCADVCRMIVLCFNLLLSSCTTFVCRFVKKL